MRHCGFSPVVSILLLLAACGDSDLEVPQTPVARDFDELAQAVAGCADALRDCRADDAGPNTSSGCRDEFVRCRLDAGKSAEEALVEEISDCRQHANQCLDDASTDAIESRCAQRLRACIGDARNSSHANSSRDGGRPNPNAPTYQCFGQLRECVTGNTRPQTCAADARTCVVAAIGDAPGQGPRVVPPSDAGVHNPSAGGSAAGAAGRPGAQPTAGRSGAAAPPPRAGSGGAGSAGRAGGGDDWSDDETARTCVEKHAACVASGTKPMTCAKEQRKCMKEGS